MKKETSWEESAFSYHRKVGEKGHEYHQKVILPRLLPLLDLKKDSSLLDLGCGQGVLSRNLPKIDFYWGLDASFSLIQEAKKLNQKSNHKFSVQNLSEKFCLPRKFSHLCFLLSLQNMEEPFEIVKRSSSFLQKKGKAVFVLNHPCFRIPRQSSWGFDEKKKLQYRRIDSYLSFLSVPIQMQPGKNPSKKSYSFHFSLQDLMKSLKQGSLVIEDLQEWPSHKISTGKKARIENRARKEIPLFLAISTLHF